MDECTMEKEIIGAATSVDKIQDTKSKLLRIYARDGIYFPHIIKVKYMADGIGYTCRKRIEQEIEHIPQEM